MNLLSPSVSLLGGYYFFCLRCHNLKSYFFNHEVEALLSLRPCDSLESSLRINFFFLQLPSPEGGIPAYIGSGEEFAHNKEMLFDDRWVLTGSFNFTRAANSKNAENILLIDDPSLAQIYKENWENRVEKAKQIFM